MLVEVVVQRLAVGAVLLLVPSRSDLDQSVGRTMPVSDHEMIAEFVPAFLAMAFVEQSGGASLRGAMMNDDRRPPRAYPPAVRLPVLFRGDSTHGAANWGRRFVHRGRSPALSIERRGRILDRRVGDAGDSEDGQDGRRPSQ